MNNENKPNNYINLSERNFNNDDNKNNSTCYCKFIVPIMCIAGLAVYFYIVTTAKHPIFFKSVNKLSVGNPCVYNNNPELLIQNRSLFLDILEQNYINFHLGKVNNPLSNLFDKGDLKIHLLFQSGHRPPTWKPIKSPTHRPTPSPSPCPTFRPTKVPTLEPTKEPTKEPTLEPTLVRTLVSTLEPTLEPTEELTLVDIIESKKSYFTKFYINSIFYSRIYY